MNKPELTSQWIWAAQRAADAVADRIYHKGNNAAQKRDNRDNRRGQRSVTAIAVRTTKGRDKGKGSSKGRGGKSKSTSNATVDRTPDGQTICRSFNMGKCRNTTCPKGFAHVCNHRLASGAACAQKHVRNTSH